MCVGCPVAHDNNKASGSRARGSGYGGGGEVVERTEPKAIGGFFFLLSEGFVCVCLGTWSAESARGFARRKQQERKDEREGKRKAGVLSTLVTEGHPQSKRAEAAAVAAAAKKKEADAKNAKRAHRERERVLFCVEFVKWLVSFYWYFGESDRSIDRKAAAAVKKAPLQDYESRFDDGPQYAPEGDVVPAKRATDPHASFVLRTDDQQPAPATPLWTRWWWERRCGLWYADLCYGGAAVSRDAGVHVPLHHENWRPAWLGVTAFRRPAAVLEQLRPVWVHVALDRGCVRAFRSPTPNGALCDPVRAHHSSQASDDART